MDSKKPFVVFLVTLPNVLFFSSIITEMVTPPSLLNRKETEGWSTAAQREGGSN